MAGTLTPERTAERFCELSPDVRAAVLLDAAGAPAGSHGLEPEAARALQELTVELVAALDRAARDLPGAPPEQLEAQVEGGAVFVTRTPRWTLAAVTRRSALSSLMLTDLRAVVDELEGGPAIRRSGFAGHPSEVEASEEEAARESPVPELGDPE
jgi:hypothetical protein